MGQCYGRTTDPIDELDDGIDSFLWRINTTPPSYLFGTIHVPYTLLWDAVPDNAKAAFNSSTHFYTEITRATDSDDYKYLPNGQHLSEVLPAKLFLKLKRRVEHIREALEVWITPEQRLRGVNATRVFESTLAHWERMLPLYAAKMVKELNRDYVINFRILTLDDFLRTSAASQKKAIGALETGKDRGRAFDKFGLEGQIFKLKEALDDLEMFGATSSGKSKSIAYYRQGHFKDLIRHFSGLIYWLDQIFLPKKQLRLEQARKECVVQDRSRQMGERIVDILRTQGQGESHFFAAGAAHFAGRCRIQAIVRAAGFEVEHIGHEKQVLGGNGRAAKEPGARFGWLRTDWRLHKYTRLVSFN